MRDAQCGWGGGRDYSLTVGQQTDSKQQEHARCVESVAPRATRKGVAAARDDVGVVKSETRRKASRNSTRMCSSAMVNPEKERIA